MIPEFSHEMTHPDPAFPAWARQFILKGERAEVLMVARNHQGHVWLHRKQVWRLPSGTLLAGEGVEAGLLREATEEFGKPLPVLRRLGTLRVLAHAAGVDGAFTSHLALLDAGDHVPSPTDDREGISGWRTIPIAGLRELAVQLRSLPPGPGPDGWRLPFWGEFRAVEHELVADLLSETTAEGSS